MLPPPPEVFALSPVGEAEGLFKASVCENPMGCVSVITEVAAEVAEARLFQSIKAYNVSAME